MRKDMFFQLKESVAKIEKEQGSLENYALISTSLEEKHIMRIREAYASFDFQEMRKVYQDLQTLELVDLLDFWENVDKNGECR